MDPENRLRSSVRPDRHAPSTCADLARFGKLGPVLGLLAGLASSTELGASTQGTTTLASLRNAGVQGNHRSLEPALSQDGRFVAFQSQAGNLVADDTLGVWNIFVRDRQSGAVGRVSVPTGGGQGNGTSLAPSISADGRYVAFQSSAPNLVPGDTNGATDAFVHDRLTGQTSRVSVATGGGQSELGGGSPQISGDGRYVAFGSTAEDLAPGIGGFNSHVFVHDRQTGQTRRVSIDSAGNLADDHSGPFALSADGRYVAFVSQAGNLVVGDTNGVEDVFVHDLTTGETRRVSVGSSGAQANDYSGQCAISADGRYVAFASEASNLVAGDTNGQEDIFVHDQGTGTTTRVSLGVGGVQANGRCFQPRISFDGFRVGFLAQASNLVVGDSNGAIDAFVHDRLNGLTRRVSVSSAGVGAGAGVASVALAGAGTHVAFASPASNLVTPDVGGFDDVFVHELAPGETTMASVCAPNLPVLGSSYDASLSADGRYVVFSSAEPDIVAAGTDGISHVYVRDRRKGVTELISQSTGGVRGNLMSRDGRITPDGRYVAFRSRATNLVPGDTLAELEVFLRDRWTGTTERVSVTSWGGQANGYSVLGAISPDGRFVTFMSAASNLVVGDTNGKHDIFVRDRVFGNTQRISWGMAGTQANDDSLEWAPISADGRYVAFSSWATNLVPGDTNGFPDVFVHDRQVGTTVIASVSSAGVQGVWASISPSLSADGRYVTFVSASNNLVPSPPPNVQHVYVRDLVTHQTERVSVDPSGQPGNSASGSDTLGAAISDEGRFVAFPSMASNLVPGDGNGVADIFLRDRLTGQTERISVDSQGLQAQGESHSVGITPDGRFVAFGSAATNLVPGPQSPTYGVYVRDRSPDAPTPFCYGDGGGAACPCGNAGKFGHGCGSSAFPGGTRLSSSGASRTSADTLVLTALESAPGQPGLFFQGSQAIQAGDGIPFGDGLRCVGGGVVRLQVRLADPGGTASSTLSISIAGAAQPGDVRRYQWWYRDPLGSPCGAGFNYSSALELTWLP